MLSNAYIWMPMDPSLVAPLRPLINIVAADESDPDLYIFDFDQDPLGIIEVGRRIRHQNGNANLLFLTKQKILDKYKNQLGRCRPTGILSKANLVDYASKAIENVSRGVYFCDPTLIDPLGGSGFGKSGPNDHTPVPRRPLKPSG